MARFLDRAISRLTLSRRVEALADKLDRLTALVSEGMRTTDRLAENIGPRPSESANPAAALGYRGDDSNAVYRGFVGSEQPLAPAPGPVPFGSTVCQQVHFTLDQYRWWTRALKDKPKFLRKQWEFVYIAQALYERGLLAPGKRGLAFGVGREPLPALFASFGVAVVATDQSLEGAVRAGWVRSREHSTDLGALNDRGICTDRMFSELVSFAEADMNAIGARFDGQFDFCWSACSLEHLGSLAHGMAFVENAMRVLKPGGVAVHTTEFNLSSNDATLESQDLSLYRRRDIDKLMEALTALGHKPSPVDYAQGEGFAETVVDLPPYGRGEPHVRLRIVDYDSTSIGLIVERG